MAAARRRRAARRPARSRRSTPTSTRWSTSTTPSDYEAARARPGREVTVGCFGALRRAGPAAARTPSAAATLGAAAAAAIGLALDRHVVAALNGDQITRDAQLPLVAGDTVAFLSADAGG